VSERCNPVGEGRVYPGIYTGDQEKICFGILRQFQEVSSSTLPLLLTLVFWWNITNYKQLVSLTVPALRCVRPFLVTTALKLPQDVKVKELESLGTSVRDDQLVYQRRLQRSVHFPQGSCHRIIYPASPLHTKVRSQRSLLLMQ